MSTPADRSPLRYIERTRDFYLALGYPNPYRWAHFDDVPFTPLVKPLENSVVTLITTANEPELPDWDGEGARPRRVYSIDSSRPPKGLYADDLGWHKEATHTEDLDTYFPIHRLQELVAEDRIGGLAARCHGVPTDFSQRRTREEHAPDIARRCARDGADVALLVPL